jgi:hypothetical protein
VDTRGGRLHRNMATQKKPPPHGRNRTAIEQTIEALRLAGRLEQVNTALIAICQTLADAVDQDPQNASLWREYRAAESALRATDDQNDDEFSSLLASLSAEVGAEAQTGTKKPRR